MAYPTPRDPIRQGRDTRERIELLERRMARSAPSREPVSWDDLEDRPVSFPSAWTQVSGKPTNFPSTWNQVSGKPTSFPSTWGTVSGKPTEFPAAPQVIPNLSVNEPPSSYPSGLSIMSARTDWPNSYATVLTARVSGSRTMQFMTIKTTGQTLVRAEGDGDAWGAWQAFMTELPNPLSDSITMVSASSATQTGWNWINSGGPESGTWLLESARLSSGNTYQRASKIAGDDFRNVWERSYRNGSWGSWNIITLPTRSFSPSIMGGVTLGNGTLSGAYEVSSGVLSGRIRLTFGSTTKVTGDVTFEPPMTTDPAVGPVNQAGDGRFQNAGRVYQAVVLMTASRIYWRYLQQLQIGNSFGSQAVGQVAFTSTDAFQWAAGDFAEIAFQYPIA